MRCTDQFEEYLRDNGVPFQMQHHARVFTAQEVAAAVMLALPARHFGRHA